MVKPDVSVHPHLNDVVINVDRNDPRSPQWRPDDLTDLQLIEVHTQFQGPCAG